MRFLLLLTVGIAATPVAASELTDADIKSEIVGRTIYLAAPLGGEFPLNYRPNGVVDGDGQALGLGRLAKPSDRGRWWVRGGRLCQQFESWYNGKPMCFVLSRAAPGTVAWLRDDGERGVARIGGAVK